MLAKKSKGKAAKAKKAAQVKATTGGGFGAPKPAALTLDEVVGGWKTRVPSDTGVDCACGLGIPYRECCRPYHQGDKAAESPEWVLRSRYTAFAYRLPEYIIRTTDKTNSDYNTDKIKWARKLNKEQMFDSFKFVGLEVGDHEDGESDKEEYLSFAVSLMPIDAAGLAKQPEPMVFTERSRFLKHAKSGTWLYAAGDVRSDAAGLKGRTLNKESDIDSFKADVDYVTSLMKNGDEGAIKDAIKEQLPGVPSLPKMPEMPKMPKMPFGD